MEIKTVLNMSEVKIFIKRNLVEFLRKEKALERFIYCVEYNKSLNSGLSISNISEGFLWSTSVEGIDHWSNLHYKFISENKA